MIAPYMILSACFLDLAIGDPRWLPHPVRLIGRAINVVEAILRKIFSSPGGELSGGILLVLFIVGPVYFLTSFLETMLLQLSGSFWPTVGTVLLVYLTATTIAAKELIRSAGLVITSVAGGDLHAARRNVSMIVGRDTSELSDKAVLRATIETVSENLSDGIVAPLFYLAIGGLPLAMAYKAVNTLDSMVGYKNERYRYFGRAAARLDDVANYIPARISGLLIVLSVFILDFSHHAGTAIASAKHSFQIMLRDGRKHPSPNSGMPEAAMAGALGVTLGGPSTYGGVLSNKSFLGDELTEDYLSASYRAITLVKISCVLAAFFAISLSFFRSAT